MMPAAPLLSWKEEFARVAAERHEKLVRQEAKAAMDRLEEEDRRKLRIKEKQEEQEAAEAIYEAIAPQEKVKAFRADLDRYDAKTVEALMQNGEELDAVRSQVRDMLRKAHILPDGRRVFLTRDEQKVFDEFGHEVSPQEVDPAGIDRRAPRYEDFAAARENERRLEEERKQLLEYQAKLDEARKRLDRGEITESELAKLKEGLSANMPDAVRQKLGLAQPPGAEAAPPTSAPSQALPDDMDKLMAQTGLGPRPAP